MRFGPRFDRHSIEARVLILQSAGWLTLLALVAATAWTSSRELSAVAAARQQQLAAVVAHQIDQVIARDLALVQALSGSPALDAEEDERALAGNQLSDAYHRATLVESIRLIERSGRVLVEEPAGEHAMPVFTALVQDAVATGQLRALALSANPLRAEILVPLRDNRGAVRVVAGVTLTPHARSISELLAAANAELVIVGASPARSQASLAIAPWSVVIADPPVSGQSSLLRAVYWMLPLTLALALLFAWGTALSVRRPALALTAAAERMAMGDLDTPLPIVPDGDEMGRLARVLEQMRQALHRDAWRQQTLRKVISAQEEERRRIARELHDDTAQSLAAVGVGLAAALHDVPEGAARTRLELLDEHVQHSLADLHRVIYDLRPSVLDDLGLVAAVRWLANEHSQRSGAAVRVEAYGLDERLPADLETAVFRVIQEALSNVERHASAETVLVQIARENSTLSVEVEDDGKGFEPEKVTVSAASARGLGLQGMRERVELMGGTFAIASSPGLGTRIAITVPI